jgi:hypothetical protein
MTSTNIDKSSKTNTGFKYITAIFRQDTGAESYQVVVGRKRKEISHSGARSLTREQAFAKALKFRNDCLGYL